LPSSPATRQSCSRAREVRAAQMYVLFHRRP
jgi:hypothetical protein